ncbi:MAG: DUF2635 domain-containing protein [Myxococcota bacterium]
MATPKKKRLHLKPLRKVVLDPVTRRPLPEQGATVVDSPYWRRRLRDKDVAVMQGPPPPRTPKKPDQGGDQASQAKGADAQKGKGANPPKPGDKKES